MPPRCATLWIGCRLGALERACLRSVLRQGHALSLYCYDEPVGVPAGVEVRDAAAILPADQIIRHRDGSVALFANRFRYELQRHGEETWIDADVYLLAPLDGSRSYLVGRQEPALLNSAVLRLPPAAPVIETLLAPFDEREVPPWLGFLERRRARRRLARTGRTGLGEMPWGTLGPHAVTAAFARHGLMQWALPEEVLYPVGHRDAAWVTDPAARLDARISPATVCVHLWNELIKDVKDRPAPRGSFLARLQEEGA